MEVGKIEEYLDRIKRWYEDYEDEFPDKIVHSSELVNGKCVAQKYKCRKGWFDGCYSFITWGIFDDYVSRDIRLMFSDFLEYDRKTNFKDRHTFRYDVLRMNEILERIIEEVEEKLNLNN